MSTARQTSLPTLRDGDRLKQPEFHRRYQAYPDNVKIELIGGIVYMASPLRLSHGRHHLELAWIFGCYKCQTPGVCGADNTTTILGPDSEPQPDLSLRILPEYGGQSRSDEDDYLVGPPELVAEVADSSEDFDRRVKKVDYRKARVQEYLVLCLKEKALHWFDFRAGKKIVANRQGIHRSRVFPGLWIDATALLALDSQRQTRVLRQGLASREHAAFVKKLDAARKRR